MKAVIKKYQIKNLDRTIAFISDIHYYDKSDKDKLDNIIFNLKDMNLDFICITGDLTDKSNIKDEEYLLNFLNDLSNMCKVIISIGNHEFYFDKKNSRFKFNNILFSKIKKIKNIYVLDNENKIIDNINFIGLTLPVEYYISKESDDIFSKYIKNINCLDNYYNILLCHSPSNINSKKYLKNLNVNLVLSGHMHGGILPRFLRIFIKHGGLIFPSKKLFPRNIYGKFNVDNKYVIITSGISVIPNVKYVRLLKNFYSSEIVIIN